MTRDDVERIVENVLRELSLEVEGSDFYGDRNSRTIKLMYRDKVITTAHFNVEDQEGYDS